MHLKLAYKLGIGFTLVLITSFSLVSWLFYSRTIDVLRDQSLDNLSNNIAFATYHIQSRLNHYREDIRFLSHLPEVREMTQAEVVPDNGFDPALLSNLEKVLVDLIEHRVEIRSIRLINSEGIEVISVGKQGEMILSPTGGRLQDKSHRNYVKKTLALPEGEIYVSPINLNRENGKVTQPHTPVMRLATPLYYKKSGELLGMLSITSDMRDALYSIQLDIQDQANRVMITNVKGDYLLHPDSRLTFGFDLGESHLIQQDYATLDTFYNDGPSSLTLNIDQNNEEGILQINKIFFDPHNFNEYLAVAVFQDTDSLLKQNQDTINDIIYIAAVLALASAAIGFLISLSPSRHIENITRAADEFTSLGRIKTSLPVHRKDEIGIFAKRFLTLTNQVREARDALESSNKDLEVQVAERTRSIKENQDRLQAVVENMVDGLILIDNKGVIQAFNWAAERIFGYATDEVIGKNIKRLMPEPYHSEHDGYISNYLNTGKAQIIGIGREVVGKRKNNTTFPMDLAVSSVTLGGETMFSGIVRDITERKEVDRMKNEFISTVSHELRTPLTSIRGSLGLISGGAVGEIPESANEMLEIANNNTQRLLLLINDILDIQKMESGQMAFNFQPMEVLPFLEQSLADNATYATEFSVKFILNSQADDAMVYADRDRMMQVMANLLSNAAKFSPEGETVEVSIAQHENDFIRISVTDHGIGIPEDFQPKLFEKFTQSDSSDTRQKGGTGLGLSISKVIVEKHGGHIEFISRQGVGSTFMVNMPRFSRTENAEGETMTQEVAEIPASILIVEDDPDVAILIRRILAESGYNADIAYDAEEAEHLLTERPEQYEAITLDLKLPGKSGMKFLTDLKENKKNIPVVVVSVVADENKRNIEGGAVNVIDWLQKPIDQDRLVSAVMQAAKNGTSRVLHVEDDKDIHRVVSLMLREYCELTWTTTLTASKYALMNEEFDLVLLDIGLPDGSGLDLLDLIEEKVRPPRVVIFSAQEVANKDAERVSAVLLKSRTDSQKLAETIKDILSKDKTRGG